jgi:hypothetical protein
VRFIIRYRIELWARMMKTITKIYSQSNECTVEALSQMFSAQLRPLSWINHKWSLKLSAPYISSYRDCKNGHSSLFKRILYHPVPVLPWQRASHSVYIEQGQSYLLCRCLDFEPCRSDRSMFSESTPPPPANPLFCVTAGVLHACNIISMDLLGPHLIPSRLSNRENTQA